MQPIGFPCTHLLLILVGIILLISIPKLAPLTSSIPVNFSNFLRGFLKYFNPSPYYTLNHCVTDYNQIVSTIIETI